MDDLRSQVNAFQKELRLVAEQLAAKHNLTLAKNAIRYDSFQYKSTLTFNVKGKEAELSSLFKSTGDPEIGTTFYYRRTGYKIVSYNRAGNLNVTRNVDGRQFIFKRNRLTGKFDYFDNTVVA